MSNNAGTETSSRRLSTVSSQGPEWGALRSAEVPPSSAAHAPPHLTGAPLAPLGLPPLL